MYDTKCADLADRVITDAMNVEKLTAAQFVFVDTHTGLLAQRIQDVIEDYMSDLESILPLVVDDARRF